MNTVVPLPKPATFDDFWQAYPKRKQPSGRWVKCEKAKARSAFARVVRAGVPVPYLIAAARWYGENKDPEYVKDCFRWLNDRTFEDYEPEDEDEPEIDVERMVARAVEAETREARQLAQRREAKAFRDDVNSDPERRDAWLNLMPHLRPKWDEWKRKWDAENGTA